MEAANSEGECLVDRKHRILKELANYERLEGLAVATQQERSGSEGRVLPCKMVFVRNAFLLSN
eukprot:6491670-Prorocentrum_lima.AAC.1